jgi:predicted metal-dependent hydrolase
MNGKNFIIERRRVKHARIIVNRQMQVRLIVPRKFSRKQVNALIEDKSDWIEKQLNHFDRIQNARVRLEKGEILYLGAVYRFQHREDLHGQVEIDACNRIIFSGANLLSRPIQDFWYRSEARRLIERKVNFWSRLHGFNFKMMVIRGQKTRWGSCSSKGNLSFNWKLIKAPEAIMDYIIFHELTHTEILNHSPAYWERLGTFYPQYRAAKTWLKANSWILD